MLASTPRVGPTARVTLLRACLPVAPAVVLVEIALDRVGGLSPALRMVLVALASAIVVAGLLSFAAYAAPEWAPALPAGRMKRASARWHGEKALAESETRMRALFDSNLVGILFGDHDGIQDANETFLAIAGYTRADLVAGLEFSDLTAPEFQHLDAAAVVEARAAGFCAPYEKQYVRKDGSRVWVLVGFVLLEPEREQSVAFVLDIDARKRTERALIESVAVRKSAEQRLRESEEEYRLLFDSNPHPMMVHDAETLALVAVNDAAVRLCGFSRDEFVGMNMRDIRPPGVAALLDDPTKRDARFGGPGEAQVRFRRKDGSLIEVAGVSNLIEFHGQRAKMVMADDVGEKGRLEAQLLQAQKMDAVGRLAGGVAHDFNNSLGVILGYTELLMRRGSGADQGKLEQILKATQRASGLTRQLLAFSRKQIVDPRILDLDALLLDLEKMLGRLIGEDVDLTIVSGADLGQVRADPGQIEQVVMNLCVNARDAMPRGGLLRIETANVDLDAGHGAEQEPVEPGRYVMLAVSDTGSGIEPEVLAKIFEPFFTTKEEGKGTGLGLAMAYGVVKQAGGHVWVYSEVGHGTTFKIYLPRIDEPVEKTMRPDVPLPARGWETILLVEDDDSLRAIAREILEEHGYRVIVGGDPGQAIETARTHPGPIHLLLTDVVMPRMNGRVLAEALVAARPTLRVLYMSGYTDDVIAHSAVLESGTLLIEKPFTALALLARVRVALGDQGARATA
jgi:two-component system, cell cycle sensor histidine kinase and response regulator CckA